MSVLDDLDAGHLLLDESPAAVEAVAEFCK